MSDLDAAIRAKLAEFVDDHLLIGEYGSPTGPGHDEMRAAIEAVLDLHRAASEDFTHIDETAYEFARRSALEEAVLAIAGKLGVEVDGG